MPTNGGEARSHVANVIDQTTRILEKVILLFLEVLLFNMSIRMVSKVVWNIVEYGLKTDHILHIQIQ
jgi:hypothetical protein